MGTDIYKEQLVVKKSDDKDTIKKIVITSAGILLSFSAVLMFGPVNSMVVVFVICFIIYKMFCRLNIEYEYIYTNGSLDIDCIFNKSSRKRKFTGTVSDFEIMAHIDDEHLKEYSQLPEVNFSSGDILGNTYVFIGTYKGKRSRIIIEPNDDLLNAMVIDLTPRKLLRKKK